MSVKEEYLLFKTKNNLKTGNFKDRVKLQIFLRNRLDDIWKEKPKFANGGLLSNYMTRLALGFAYYDCKPSDFCKTRCYGLPISGLHDYNMLRLGVITSESLKTGDPRFLNPLSKEIKELNLKCLKIGHWGDAVLEQVPVIAKLVEKNPNTTFWWYTRKKEVAIKANECGLPNLKAYLSLDSTTPYPSFNDYPFGITYLLGKRDEDKHEHHYEILLDGRLVAVFPLKQEKDFKDIENHPKICVEKKLRAELGPKGHEICLSCSGRCNYSYKTA